MPLPKMGRAECNDFREAAALIFARDLEGLVVCEWRRTEDLFCSLICINLLPQLRE
jgi:hypothetical protein